MKAAATLITLGVLAIVDTIQRNNDNPDVYYVEEIIGGFNGMIVPGVGVFIRKDKKGQEMLLKHEMIHWKQYQKEGFLSFLVNYGWEHIKNGYDGNMYEIEARMLSGENDACIHDYTNCVRTGRADTNHNPVFRR